MWISLFSLTFQTIRLTIMIYESIHWLIGWLEAWKKKIVHRHFYRSLILDTSRLRTCLVWGLFGEEFLPQELGTESDTYRDTVSLFDVARERRSSKHQVVFRLQKVILYNFGYLHIFFFNLFFNFLLLHFINIYVFILLLI